MCFGIKTREQLSEMTKIFTKLGNRNLVRTFRMTFKSCNKNDFNKQRKTVNTVILFRY